MVWNKWWVFGWAAIILGILFYEFWSGWGTGKHTPMLTQVVVHWVPRWPMMIFLTWLWVHFALRYWNSAYKASLDTAHPFKGFI